MWGRPEWEHLKIQCSESANQSLPCLILKRECPLRDLALYKEAFTRILLYSMQQCVHKQRLQPKRTDCLTDMKVLHVHYNITKILCTSAQSLALTMMGPQGKPRLLRKLNHTFRLRNWAVISDTTKKKCVYKNQLKFLVRPLKRKGNLINQPQRGSFI